MEDIRENDIFNAFLSWRSDGLTPLTTIQGYTELLLRSTVGTLTQEQRKFLQVIHSSANRALDSWHYPTLYLQLRYSQYEPICEEQSLAELLQNEIKSLGNNNEQDSVLINVSKMLPTIRSSQALAAAFRVFLAPHLLFREINCETIISAVPQSEVAGITITGPYASVYHAIQHNLSLYWPGSPLDTAYRILQLHGSTIQIDTQGTNVVFSFSLHYWRAEA